MEKRAQASRKQERRGWGISFLTAAATVGVGIIFSATINPFLDRSVHWDWMAGIAPVLFVGLALGLRWRRL